MKTQVTDAYGYGDFSNQQRLEQHAARRLAYNEGARDLPLVIHDVTNAQRIDDDLEQIRKNRRRRCLSSVFSRLVNGQEVVASGRVWIFDDVRDAVNRDPELVSISRQLLDAKTNNERERAAEAYQWLFNRTAYRFAVRLADVILDDLDQDLADQVFVEARSLAIGKQIAGVV